MHKRFWLENIKLRDYWKSPGVDGNIRSKEVILKDIEQELLRWRDKARSRINYWCFVNTVMNIRFRKHAGELLKNWENDISKGKLGSTESVTF